MSEVNDEAIFFDSQDCHIAVAPRDDGNQAFLSMMKNTMRLPTRRRKSHHFPRLSLGIVVKVSSPLA